MSKIRSIIFILLISALNHQSIYPALYETVQSKLTSFKKSFDDNLHAIIVCLQQRSKCTIKKEQVYKALKIGGIMMIALAAIKLYRPVKGMKKINNLLLKASEQGNYRDVKLALALGADVNTKDNVYGNTPLMQAAVNLGKTKYKLNIIKELVKSGADLYVKNKWGNTPFSVLEWHADTIDLAGFKEEIAKIIQNIRMKAIKAEQKDPRSYLHKLPEDVIEQKIEKYLTTP